MVCMPCVILFFSRVVGPVNIMGYHSNEQVTNQLTFKLIERRLSQVELTYSNEPLMRRWAFSKRFSQWPWRRKLPYFERREPSCQNMKVESGPWLTVERNWGLQSYNCKIMNSDNNQRVWKRAPSLRCDGNSGCHLDFTLVRF